MTFVTPLTVGARALINASVTCRRERKAALTRPRRRLRASSKLWACQSGRDEPDKGDAGESSGGDSGGQNRPGEMPEAWREAVLQQRLQDWRTFRARLVQSEARERSHAADRAPGASPAAAAGDATLNEARWVHPVGMLESGCVLVASPEHFQNDQQYFANTVILVLEHGRNGSTGVVLNRRASGRLSALQALQHTPLVQSFADSPLFLGGPVGLDSLLVLHGEGKLVQEKSEEGRLGDASAYEIIAGGVYCGGLEQLTQLANARLLARPEAVRFCCGYCGWGPGQLQDEVDAGVWYLASASAELILGTTPPADDEPFGDELPTEFWPQTNVSPERPFRQRRRYAAAGMLTDADTDTTDPMRLWNEVIDKLRQYR